MVNNVCIYFTINVIIYIVKTLIYIMDDNNSERERPTIKTMMAFHGDFEKPSNWDSKYELRWNLYQIRDHIVLQQMCERSIRKFKESITNDIK